MQKILHTIKNRRSLPLLFAAVMALAVFANVPAAKSDNCPGFVPQTPAFDWWPLTYNPNATCADFALIDARNLSSNDTRDSRYALSQSEHDAGIHAGIGDTVRVSIYFHNGASDQISRSQTTAHNVQISSSYSTDPTDYHVISGGISASNAPGVTDVGHGGPISVHTDVPTVLQYVPGTSELCISYQAAKERGADLTKTCGMSGDGLPKIAVPIGDGVANGSVGIGDIKACWTYSGTLIYSVQVLAATSTGSQSSLVISKTVRDLSNNEPNYGPSVNAHPGDKLDFQITVADSSSTAIAQNVNVEDALPFGLQYAGGDQTILSSTGESIGSLNPGQSQTFNFTATVIQAASGTITNTASASATNAASVSGSANINVQPQPVLPVTISGTNLVRDIANNEPNYGPSVTARPGDQVDFQLNITNTSSSAAANNVVVTDTLPSNFSLVNGSADPSLFASGLNIGNIAPSQTYTINFSAITPQVANEVTESNSATAVGSNTNSILMSAVVIVAPVPAITTTSLSLAKQVRDIANNEPNFGSSVNARPGDQVDFQIVVTNTGQATANNVVIMDTLPQGLGMIFPSSVNSSLFTTGLNIGNLAQGQSETFNFSNTVNSSDTAQSLVNNASASASNAQTATANAIVNVVPLQQNLPITITSTNLVRDVANNEPSFGPSVIALPGDQVDFQLAVTNTSYTGTANNVVATDTLPSGFSLVNGSVDPSLFSTGVQLGNIAPGQTETINFSAIAPQAQSTQSFTDNFAAVGANTNTTTASSSVMVLATPPPSSGSLSLTKQVRDISNNQPNFGSSVNARPGDQVDFQIVVTNTGQATANNVNLTDNMPFGLSSLNYNTASASDNIGNLYPGQSATWNLSAIVGQAVSQSSTLTNAAFATSSNAPTVTATATVYVAQPFAPGNISITKYVRDVTQGQSAFQSSINANNGDTLQYQITATNTGSGTVSNLNISDSLPGGVNFTPNSFNINTGTFNSAFNSSVTVPTLYQNQSVVITYSVQVNQANGAIINTASVTGNPNLYASAQAVVNVFSAAQAVNLVLSKSAFNDTQNVDATTVNANREDYITYTLNVTNNSSSTAQNYVISDDLSNVLNNAGMVDNGGGTMVGNTITWPAQNIAAGSSVQEKFKVRVNYYLPTNTQVFLVNTFGNTVSIRVNVPQVLGAITAPKTGASADVGFAFAGLFTAAFAVAKRKLKFKSRR